MTATDLPNELINRVLEYVAVGAWVPLGDYLRLYPSETKEAVYTRRSRGFWQDGKHTSLKKGAGLWVNLIEVNKWASKTESKEKSALPKA